MKKFTLISITIILSSIVLCSQSNFFDQSFAQGGRFVHNFTAGHSRLYSIKLQPDGKIIAGGYINLNGTERSIVLRCTTDGVLDPTFGLYGIWTSNDPFFGIATKLFIQPDGKILVSGIGWSTFKVIRLLPNGALDPSFGSNGKTEISVYPWTTVQSVYHLELLPDGKIILLGRENPTGGHYEYLIMRLNSNGKIDHTFGDLGVIKVSKDKIGSPQFSNGTSMCVFPDKSMIIAQNVYDPINHTEFFATRFTPEGVVDSTFANKGSFSLTQQEGMYEVTNVFPLPGRDFYLMGSTNVVEQNHSYTATGLVRVKANGNLDNSFAVNGIGKLSFALPPSYSSSIPYRGTLQSDGKVLAFGGPLSGLGFLGRFDTNGLCDSTLGNAGIIRPQYNFEEFFDSVVQPDGKVLAVGKYSNIVGKDICSIVRYKGSNNVGFAELSPNLQSLQAYPNPVADSELNLQFELPEKTDLLITLLDLQGRALSAFPETSYEAGPQQETLTLPPGLPEGLYLLKLQTKTGSTMLKISVVKP